MDTFNREFIVFKDRDELAEFAFNKVSDVLNDAIDKRGRATIALSGGTSPIVFFEKLSAADIDWMKVHFFIVDERFVSRNSHMCNFRLAKEHLLDRIDIPEENLHPVPIEIDVETSAKRYESAIKKFFSHGQTEIPEFDVIQLGLGADGHTASLFPNQPALEDTNLVAAVEYDKVPQKRITLTLKVINNARYVIFIAPGQEKIGPLKVIFNGKDPEIPASLVDLNHGELLFLLDEVAGEFLK